MKQRVNDSLHLALQIANAIPFVKGEKRIASVAYDKKGRVIAIGVNNYKKSHPIQAKYAKMNGLDGKIFLHSEVNCLLKCKDKEVYKLQIVRVDSKGKECLAKPCPICEAYIRDRGVKVIEYTL